MLPLLSLSHVSFGPDQSYAGHLSSLNDLMTIQDADSSDEEEDGDDEDAEEEGA